MAAINGTYRGYFYKVYLDGTCLLYTKDTVMECVSLVECMEQIDYLVDEIESKIARAPDKYYVYRIGKQDIDTQDNYQYFDGKHFQYDALRIRYMDYTRAQSIVRRYEKKSGQYNYHMSKKAG